MTPAAGIVPVFPGEAHERIISVIPTYVTVSDACDHMRSDRPPTYLDKQNSQNERYVLISYSHSDSGWVYPILDRLNSLGLNYWYDTELCNGDEWNVVVGERIKDEKCVGAILFTSYNYMRSRACEQEMRAVHDEVQKRRYRYFAVSPRHASPGDMLVRSYVMNSSEIKAGMLDELRGCNDDKIIEYIRDNLIAPFPIERAEIVSKLFPSNKIWTSTDQGDDEEHRAFAVDESFFEKIIDSFEHDGVVNNADTIASKLNLKKDESGVSIMEFATYPIRDRYDSQGMVNGNFMRAVPNEWYMAGVVGDVVTLISRYPLVTEVSAKMDDIDRVMRRFKDNCLSMDEKDVLMEPPRLLTIGEFNEYFTDGGLDPVCKFNPLEKRGGATSWAVLNDTGRCSMISVAGKLIKGTCSPVNKLGIRPVLRISLSAFIGKR